MVRGRTLARAAVALIATSLALGACREPTQIRVIVTTDARCEDLGSTAVSVGGMGEIEGRPASSTTSTCEMASGLIGDVVIVPAGSDDGEFALNVVTGVKQRADDCMPPDYKGCIVSRRALGFVPGRSLDVEVLQQIACVDVPCGALATCRNGECLPLQCVEPGSCPEGDGGQQDADAGSGACDDSSLVLCMRFEDSTADEAHAQTVNVAGSVQYIAGKAGKAVHVGPSTTIHVPHGPAWAYTKLSVEMWVKADAFPRFGTRAGLIDKQNSFGIFLQPDGDVVCSAGASVTAAAVVTVGTWVHIACVSDGAKTTLYANGIAKTTAPSGGVAPTADITAIGGNSPFGEPFSGALDTLRVYARVLTPAEITAAAQP